MPLLAFCHRAALPLAFCLLTLAGCSGSNPYAATERAIRERLPEYIGPARAYDVRISRSAARLLRGELGWVEIHGQAVEAEPGLTVDDLQVRLEDVLVNRRTRAIRSVGSAAFTARISAESASRYVARRGPDYAGVRITFENGETVVHATPAFLGVHVPVNVAGRPVVRGDRIVDFEATRLALGVVPLPGLLLPRLEQRINPILDLSTLRFPVHIDAIHLNPGHAVIVGTATFPTTNDE